MSECLSLKTGVKQGCVLSPLPFNIFIDSIVRTVMRVVGETGITIRYSKQRKWFTLKEKELTEETLVNTLLYADDMVVLDSKFENVKGFVLELDKQLSSVGMMMNVKKTKMMVLNGKVVEPIVIRGEKIDVEDSFPYLGVNVRIQQSSSCEEVALRLSKAVKVYKALYHPLWKRKQVSLETKMAIYRGAVLPSLLYGCETWVLSEIESQRLEVFQMKCLRGILGITKFDHRRNEDILEETKQSTVGELVTRSRLRWLGHVVRMADDRLPPQLLFGKIAGKSKRGRPLGRWKDMIEKDLKKRKVQSCWYNVVQDRNEWRKVVHGDTKNVRVKRRAEEDEVEDLVEFRMFCPKCGKGYRNNKGGFFRRHVDSCNIVVSSMVSPSIVVSSIDGGSVDGCRVDGCSVDGGSVENKQIVVEDNSGELVCQKCGKFYRSKHWFKKHVDKCGPSQPGSG